MMIIRHAKYIICILFLFIWIRGNPTPRKAHFMDPGEFVKLRLSQALIKSARPDSNSRPAVQI
jgi:hypothetical protein